MGREQGGRALAFEIAELDDAMFWSDVYTVAQPIRPVDPLVTRYGWEHPARLWRIARYIVVRDGKRIGVASWERPEWESAETRFALMNGELLPEHRDAPTLALILGRMEREIIAEGAAIICGGANEDDVFRMDVLRALGSSR